MSDIKREELKKLYQEEKIIVMETKFMNTYIGDIGEDIEFLDYVSMNIL